MYFFAGFFWNLSLCMTKLRVLVLCFYYFTDNSNITYNLGLVPCLPLWFSVPISFHHSIGLVSLPCFRKLLVLLPSRENQEPKRISGFPPYLHLLPASFLLFFSLIHQSINQSVYPHEAKSLTTKDLTRGLVV